MQDHWRLGEYDQSHGSQCASLELTVQVVQRIQYRYKDRFIGGSALSRQATGKKTGKGQAKGSAGTSATRGLVRIASTLLEFIANKKHSEMLLLKEDRKLAAERAYALVIAKPPADDI